MKDRNYVNIYGCVSRILSLQGMTMLIQFEILLVIIDMQLGFLL